MSEIEHADVRLSAIRTTIELDDDTAAEVEPFVPRTHRLGLKLDVSNIADVLDGSRS
jgi:hypothetical protein